MSYNQKLDKEIKTWQHQGGLYVSLHQYNGGDPKIQIGPRAYRKSDGSLGYGRTGRLSLEEMGWLFGLKDEIREAIKSVKPTKK